MDKNTFIPIAGQPELRVRAHIHGDNTVMLEYIGSGEQILALGVVAASVLDPWRKGTPKGWKRDIHGDKVWVDRFYISRGGVPTRRYRVRLRDKLMENAVQLPGAPGAIELAWGVYAEFQERTRRYNEEHRVAAERSDERSETSGRPARPSYLRLVGDNTR